MELKQIQQMIQKQNLTVILMPTFKSYVDFLLLTYIHIMYEVDLPFVVGLKEFDEIPVISKILRRCGGIFVNKKHL